MFNETHYVPVLRWKQSEWLALNSLETEVKDAMTPLIEMIPAKLNIPDQLLRVRHVSKTCEDIERCWGRMPIFVDLRHCPAHDVSVWNLMNTQAREMRLDLIPVVNLGQSLNWQQAVADSVNRRKPRICLRLEIKDFKANIKTRIDQTLSNLSLAPSVIDLVIDCGIVGIQNLPNYNNILGSLPYINQWLSLSMVGGAFPKDLTQFRPGIHRLDRLEWLNWRRQVAEQTLVRIPTFGDYAIQHAIYSEPPARANFSASIRYASEDYWVIMRGEGVFTEGGPGFAQYPAQAALLREQEEFKGRDFSAGDRYIADMQLQTNKPGSAGSWLQAGLNHHLTLVVDELANLDEILIVDVQARR